MTPRSGNYRPLFTLWSDTNNWIEFGAYASGGSGVDTGRFRLRIKAAGTLLDPFDWPRDDNGDLKDNVYWSRASQLLIGISFDGTFVRVGASLGGDQLRDAGGATLPTPGFSTGYNFNTLTFGGAGGEVTTFRWFGGKAVDGSAMSVSSMITQFRTLEFLS